MGLQQDRWGSNTSPRVLPQSYDDYRDAWEGAWRPKWALHASV